jgi:DNA-directed RNA polymerase specialized sigma24 family protein
MSGESEVAVTLSNELLDHLRSEARRLEIPLEWLVASLVVDTIDEEADVDEESFEPALV